MRLPPRWTEFHNYPVVGGIAILSVATTLAWWAKLNVEPLFPSAMIRRGELWRLITCMLPHGGVLHLAFNIYWLWVFGTLIEEIYGHARTLALILLFALGSGALEFTFAAGGIGLSGVGYGLFGLLWVLSRHDERFANAVDAKTVQLFIAWFFLCIVTTWFGIFEVANIAHAGGLILGLLVGAAIAQPARRFVLISSIVVFLSCGIWGATAGRPRLNFSGKEGYEEGKWGYDALMAGHNKEAARWLKDAVAYQPGTAVYWYDLGIAYERLGNKPAALTAYQRAHQLEPQQADFSTAAKGLE